MILIFGAGDMAEQGIVPVVGGELITQHECDVRKLDQVHRIMAEIIPSTVIFTAGVSRPAMMIDYQSDDYIDEIETNLIGAFNVARCATDIGATMIFIASVAAMHGKPHHSGYCASKSGVISLVQSLAMEGYDAYAISPGRVDTSMRQKDYPNDTPGSRLEPREIGELVRDILEGQYESGDNLIIRRIGLETVPIKIDKGPWRDELRVGQPVII